MKQSYIFLTEFNEWVGTLINATQDEYTQYLEEIKNRLREDGKPEQTEIIIYKVDPVSIIIKL